MKIAVFASLLFAATHLPAQQSWCFSQQCQETQVMSFQRAGQSPFYTPQRRINVPAYRPVLPLAPSLSTQTFFRFSESTLRNPFTNASRVNGSASSVLQPAFPWEPLTTGAPQSEPSPQRLSIRSGGGSTNRFSTGTQGFGVAGTPRK